MFDQDAREYFVTNDPALLDDYYELRHRVYLRHYRTLAPGFGFHEPADDRSDIVVCLSRGSLIAGGCLTTSYPRRPAVLPLEERDFRLADALPELDLPNKAYSEIFRYVADPARAERKTVAQTLACALLRLAASNRVDIVFSICPAPMVRINRLASLACGVEFHEFPRVGIRTQFDIPMTLCGYTGMK